MKPVHCEYDNVSSFFWDTSLPMERREAIVNWVKSLPDDKRTLLNDLISDVKQNEYFDATYQG